MKMTLLGRHARPSSGSRLLNTAALCVPLLLLASGTAWGQRIRVTGTVNSPGGTPLTGASVRVVGDTGAVTTNVSGKYTISAPQNGTLRVSFVGYSPSTVPIGGRTSIDFTLSRLTLLEQVVVTSGYGGDAQRRSQITGAVGTVSVEATQNRSTASVVQHLDATVSGVTVTANGSPGSRSTVRIRGVSSFQNNDPLYIIDGTPIQDTYVNFLNPEDIESIQVLKDASAASIYGSRASNGVIIIQTRKGGASGAPRTTLSVRTGTQSPINGYDKFLLTDALQYYQVQKQSYLNAGLKPPTNIFGDPNNPSVPAYTYAEPGTYDPKAGVDAYGRPVNVNTNLYSYPRNLIMPGSTGTDWWKAVFSSAPVSEVNLGVTGSGTGTQYAVSGNYFDQTGTAAYNRYRRGSVRANTSLTRGGFTFGENLAVIGEGSVGGQAGDVGTSAEGSILGKNILMQPVVPIYDVAGNFASGKANTLGNNTNPLQAAYQARNNTSVTDRFFGNVFANYDLTSHIALRTVLGGNVGTNSYQQYSGSTPQNSEASFGDGYYEYTNRFTDYTWSNTARYNQQSGRHNLAVLLGHEINRGNSQYLQGAVNNLVSNDVNSLYINSALGTLGLPFSSAGQYALVSFFGKTDYTYNDRYTISGTVRRDGSSRLGPNNRWGTFPSGGLSWHASRESFLENNPIVSDLQFRIGYGITGNQQIPSGRTVNQYGGDLGSTAYNITGGSSLSTGTGTGYRLTSLGNPDLKWESNRSVNAGFDLGLYHNNVSVIFDFFNRVTNDLLYAPLTPGTAGQAAPPFVNIAGMRNAGFDFSVGHQGRSWSLNFNGSHYSNKIVRIAGGQTFFMGYGVRQGNVTINQVGQPVGSFYGLVADGYFKDSADVANSPTQDGAAPGRIKFKDVNGDGKVTLADRTIIGSPHPKFTSGLDGTYRLGRFELGGTLFGTFGNKIFDAQKQWYVFRTFDTNVRNDLLTNSWTPTNQNAKYPRLDVSDTFSRAISSYYVENGSYVRLQNLRLGYTLPSTRYRFLPAGSRLYVQAENLFTITGYEGLDPAISAGNVSGSSGDVRDQFRGVDQGIYPTSRTFSVGLTTTF